MMDPRKINGWRLQNEEGGAEGGNGDTGGGAEGGAVDWRNSLPEEIRDSSALSDFKDVGSLAKSFIDTQSHIGNSIRVPSDEAGEEDRKAFLEKVAAKAPELMLKPNFENEEQSREFYRTMGMPEKADQYEIPEIENFELPTERVEFLQNVAHKNGVTKKQFAGFMKEVFEADAAAAVQMQEEAGNGVQQSMDSLKGEWGHAFDERMVAARNFATESGAPQALVDAISNGQVGGDVYKWLHGLSSKVGSESTGAGDDGRHGARTLTPAEATAQISEINNNKAHPYWDGHHPEHKTAVQKMVALMKAANPSQ